MYHGTTAAKARQIQASKLLCSAAEPHVYVSDSPDIWEYGDGTIVKVLVPTARMELNDEFPSGRKDYSIYVGRQKCVRIRGAKIMKRRER
jgi:hypothetical protein